jgi:hypothetical protein
LSLRRTPVAHLALGLTGLILCRRKGQFRRVARDLAADKKCKIVFSISQISLKSCTISRTAGATVARSTPDRKVIRSNRVWFISSPLFLTFWPRVQAWKGWGERLGSEVLYTEFTASMPCMRFFLLCYRGCWNLRRAKQAQIYAGASEKKGYVEASGESAGQRQLVDFY